MNAVYVKTSQCLERVPEKKRIKKSCDTVSSKATNEMFTNNTGRKRNSLGSHSHGEMQRIQSGALQRVGWTHCNPHRPSNRAP